MKALIAAAAPLAALAIVLAGGARAAGADDKPIVFRVHNNLDQTAGVWISSEKSTKADPWTHLDIEPDKDGTFRLDAPDRFIIAVDVGNQRSRSKPVALKSFLAAHPDYVLKVNLNLATTTGVDLEELLKHKDDPPKDEPIDVRFDFVPTAPVNDVGASKPSAATAPVEIPKFEFRDNDGAVPFKVYNGLHQTIGLWVASEKSTRENPWVHIEIEPGTTGKVGLKAPDRYTLAIDIGKQRYRSKPVALQAFLDKHSDYGLDVLEERTEGAKADAPPKYEIKFDSFNLPIDSRPNVSGLTNDIKPIAPPKPDTLPFDFTVEPVPASTGQQSDGESGGQ